MPAMSLVKCSVSDHAYARLKEQILSRVYSPGMQLVELEVSRRLDIGRTPVREALRRLREEGLVRVVHNRGAFVERMAFSDVEDALFLREVLEVAALSRGLNNIPAKRLSDLDSSFARFARSRQPFPEAECLAADIALHELIVDAAGSPRLKKFHGQLADQIHFVRRLQVAHMRASIPHHRAIIRALRARNATAAERALRKHMAQVHENLHQYRHLL